MQSDQKQHILKTVEKIQRTNEAHIIYGYKKRSNALLQPLLTLNLIL